MSDTEVPLLGTDLLLLTAAGSSDAVGQTSCRDWWRVVYKDGVPLRVPVNSRTSCSDRMAVECLSLPLAQRCGSQGHPNKSLAC